MMMSKKNRWIISPYGITDNFSSSSKFFSTGTRNKSDLSNLRRILNIIEKNQKSRLEIVRDNNKLIRILNIFNHYIPFEKFLKFYDHCYLLSVINGVSAVDIYNSKFKKDYESSYELYKKDINVLSGFNHNNEVEVYDFLYRIADRYISEERVVLKIEDTKEIESIITSISDHVSDSHVLSDRIMDVSKQTVFFDFSPIFNNIEVLLTNKDNKTVSEIQLEIEKLLHIAWTDSLNLKIKDLKNKNTVISESFKLLHKYVIDYNSNIDYIRKSIKNKKKKYELALKPLFELDNNTISVIVFNNVLPILSLMDGSPRNEILMRIGTQLFHRWCLKLYNEKKNSEQILSFKEFKASLNITLTDKGVLGEILLNQLIEMGTLLDIKIVPTSSDHVESRIVPSPNCIKLFEKSFDLVGFKLPMVCPPAPWGRGQDGGYLLNKEFHFDEMIHQSVNNVTPTIIEKNNEIYEQINYMSSIPFKINKKVLRLVLEQGVEKGLILGSLHKDTDRINELSSSEKAKVLSHNSRYFQERNILGIAQLYSNVDRFYFPLFFDWRGRIYNDSSYLNYQSISLAKALLMFAEGKSMKVIDLFSRGKDSYKFVGLPDSGFKSDFWLKVYGANCFGGGAKNLSEKFGKYNFNLDLDKLSYNDRFNWINSHHNNIISLDPKFWTKADEPLLFLAFCFEYKDYYENQDNFLTHLPIQLDATCNGLQHLSIMSANANLAKLVNLLPNTEDQNPFDLYSVALEEIKKNIKKVIAKEDSYIRLNNLNLDRKIVKRSIMTIPYNVTVNGIVEHLKEFFYLEKVENNYLYIPKEEKHGTKYIGGKDLFKLAQIIHNVLYKTHPELESVVSYFKDMVSLLTRLELPVVWITPGGLKIKQKYAKKKSIRVRSGLYKGADYTIVVPTDKIDKISQQSAFMPNLIHSMDGSTITLLVKKLRALDMYNIYTIHDCFATTADNISIINELVRETFCEIYTGEDFLLRLHRFFLLYINGNFEILHGNKTFTGKTWISKDMATEETFQVISSNGLIEIPKLPTSGEFQELYENIKKAIYLIN